MSTHGLHRVWRVGGWLVWAAVSLSTTPAPAQTLTVRDYFVGRPGTVMKVVTARGAQNFGWLKDLLPGVNLEFTTPAIASGWTGASKESAFLFLVDMSRLSEWPPALVKGLGLDSGMAQADLGHVFTEPYLGVHRSVVLAPTASWLAVGMQTLCERSFDGAFVKKRNPVIDTQVQLATLVADNPAPALDWIERVAQQRQSTWAVNVVAPNEAATALARLNPTLSLALLTPEQWRQLSPDNQQALKPYLGDRVLRALTSEGGNRVASAKLEAGEGRERYALCVPRAEGFANYLTDQNQMSANHPLSRVWLGRGETGGGEGELLPLPNVRRLAVIGAGRNNPVAQQRTDEVASELKRQLSDLGFEVTDRDSIDKGVDLQLLAEALAAGRATDFHGFDGFVVVRVQNYEGHRRLEPGELRPLRKLPRRPAPPGQKQPDPNPLDFGDIFKRPMTIQEWQNYERLWELPIAERQTVQLLGHVEFYTPSASLTGSVPLSLRETQERVIRRQFRTTQSNEPPAAQVQRGDHAELDLAFLNACLVKTAGRAASYLAGCYNTQDRGPGRSQPGTERPQSSPATPVATATDQTTTVEVTGRGPRVEVAKRDALRQAIEQVAGVYVSAGTTVKDWQLQKDEVVTRSLGFANFVGEPQVTQAGGEVEVRCRVAVTNKPMRTVLAKLRLLRIWRVMVVLGDGPEGQQVWSGAQAVLLDALREIGFMVVDRAWAAELRAPGGLFEGLVGQREKANALRDKYQADILITGNGQAEPAGDRAGNRVVRASITLRGIYLGTAEILSSPRCAVTGTDRTPEAAQRKALELGATQMADKLIDDLVKATVPSQDATKRTIALSGLTGYSQWKKFKEALKKVDGVKSVAEVSFDAPLGRVEVEVDPSTDLAAELEDNDALKSFRIRVKKAGTVIEATIGP